MINDSFKEDTLIINLIDTSRITNSNFFAISNGIKGLKEKI